MTAATLLLAALFTVLMVRRGCRRGALATLVGWTPPALSVGAMALVVWCSTLPLSVTIACAVIAAGVTLIVSAFTTRTVRRRLATPCLEHAPRSTSARWLRRGDSVAGGALALLCSAVTCLGIACLGSTLAFAFSVHTQDADKKMTADNPPHWITALRHSCRTLAEVSDLAVLQHVPRLGDYGREVRALVTILNAPPDRLDRLANKHGLQRLLDLPEVKAAIADEHYVGLYQRLREGNLAVVAELLDSPVTHQLVACPQLRDAARSLTPSKLAGELTSPDSAQISMTH